MNFDIDVQQIQVFTCADGTQFYNLDEAKAYNQKLKHAAELAELNAEIERTVDSYLNVLNIETRQGRAQKRNVVKDFMEWYMTWDKVTVEETRPEVAEESAEEVVEEVAEDSIPF